MPIPHSINKLLLMAFAIFVLTACSDSDKPPATTKIQLSTFQHMLKQVPADTPYLFINKTLPSPDVTLANNRRNRDMLSHWEKTAETNKDSEPAKDSESQQPLKESQDIAKLEIFWINLMQTLYADTGAKKTTPTGFVDAPHVAIYGLGMTPIMRLEINNAPAFKASIQTAAKKAELNLEWKTCGKFDCIDMQLDQFGLAFVIQDKQISLSLFMTSDHDRVIDHLIGQTKPTASYQAKTWDEFLNTHHYSGLGDGFINLEKTYHKLEGLLQENLLKKDPSLNIKTFKACSNLAKLHLQHMPKITTGIKSMTEDKIDIEVIFNTSPLVTTALQTLPNPLNGMKQAVNPLIDFGINLNLVNLQTSLGDYSKFLINQAKKLNCDAIEPASITQAVGSLAMASMMGGNQFNNAYLALNAVTLDASNSVEKIELYAAVGLNQPNALFQILAAFNPLFLTFELPENGDIIQLPKEFIPETGQAVTPDIFLSQKNKVLDVRVGAKDPALSTISNQNSLLFWTRLDSQRYLDLIINAMPDKPAPTKGTKPTEFGDIKSALKQLKQSFGKMSSQISVNQHGLAIDYSIEFIPETHTKK